ncbi:LysR family transcriptional regulator [Bauldia sp.]|uniref:LysR family transcriptional regulator n=1 Tax=Bauldia sp. TaxID=2575872 RepID=UPI003BAB8745
MMNWDDLRVAIAVFESGSYAGAAARLNVDETTVARRLGRLQDGIGVPLFEAVDGVRKPTAACKRLVSLAADMAVKAEQIEHLTSDVDSLIGHRRIATTDSIATEVLAPNAPSFLGDHPGLSLEFMASTENVNFSRWEADIAIRLGKPERGDFIVSKLADLPLFLFAPKTAGVPPLVCAYPESLDQTPESRYLEEVGLKPQARMTTKNLLVLKMLVQSGQAATVLPGYMRAGLDEALLRVEELPVRREAWLLIQSHLKQDAATRAVIDWVRDCFRRIA